MRYHIIQLTHAQIQSSKQASKHHLETLPSAFSLVPKTSNSVRIFVVLIHPIHFVGVSLHNPVNNFGNHPTSRIIILECRFGRFKVGFESSFDTALHDHDELARIGCAHNVVGFIGQFVRASPLSRIRSQRLMAGTGFVGTTTTDLDIGIGFVTCWRPLVSRKGREGRSETISVTRRTIPITEITVAWQGFWFQFAAMIRIDTVLLEISHNSARATQRFIVRTLTFSFAKGLTLFPGGDARSFIRPVPIAFNKIS